MALNKEERLQTIDDRALARILLGKECKPSSWKTIQKMARNGQIPGRQIGRTWRFDLSAVRAYLKGA